MTVSIALCTYNGEKFLQDQLESYTHQTKLPDELIICDDQSTDNTVKIIESFQDSAPFNVRLYVNPSRLGSTKNFEHAISQCTGDIIFLSDQDDWWYQQKIRTVVERLGEKDNRACGGVFSDAEIVDENMIYQNRNLWESIGFNRKKRRNFARGETIPLLFKRDVVTGATMAFDANFKKLILPIPENWVHDAWISLMLAYASNLCMIEQPLIKYRQHRFQQIGARKPTFSHRAEAIRTGLHNKNDYYLQEAGILKQAYERILKFQAELKDPCSIKVLRDNIDHLENRASIRNGDASRIIIPMKELVSGRYHKYSLGWNSFFKDLVIGH